MMSGTNNASLARLRKDRTEARDEPRRQSFRSPSEAANAIPGNRLMNPRSDKMLAALHAQIAERDRRIAELEERNAELEGYAYTVSHDLKTPLVTIKGFISFLHRDVRTGDHKRIDHDLSRISYAADRMQRLLDDLLELSRVGRVGKKPCQVPLAELVDEAIDRVADTLEERAAEVLVAPSLPEVYGDRSLLVDVLEQLIDNAVTHAGEQPAPCVEIGARRGDTEVVLFVRDNGPGIHPRFHDKVFQLFERIDPDGSEGTGVGLTLVKRIVDFHGGRIWIESSGRGSTMCFTLPGTRGRSD